MIIVFDGGAGCITGGRVERSSFRFAFARDDRLLLFGVSTGDEDEDGSVLDIVIVSGWPLKCYWTRRASRRYRHKKARRTFEHLGL
jgi:hypothetical protein